MHTLEKRNIINITTEGTDSPHNIVGQQLRFGLAKQDKITHMKSIFCFNQPTKLPPRK
jgi:hypothetical protein